MTEEKKRQEEAERASRDAWNAAQRSADLSFGVLQAKRSAPFSYDIDGDALYEQYKDKYTALGRAAMEDAVGKASQLTGGYMNSYAATAGQQAYDRYLTQLGDAALTLEDRAYERYRDGIGDAREDYGLLTEAADRAYSRWQDQIKAGRYGDETAYAREQDAADRAYDYDKLLASTGFDLRTDEGRKAYAESAAETAAEERAAKDLKEQGIPVPEKADALRKEVAAAVAAGDTLAADRLLLYADRLGYAAWADMMRTVYAVPRIASGTGDGTGAGNGTGTGTGNGAWSGTGSGKGTETGPASGKDPGTGAAAIGALSGMIPRTLAPDDGTAAAALTAYAAALASQSLTEGVPTGKKKKQK